MGVRPIEEERYNSAYDPFFHLKCEISRLKDELYQSRIERKALEFKISDKESELLRFKYQIETKDMDKLQMLSKYGMPLGD